MSAATLALALFLVSGDPACGRAVSADVESPEAALVERLVFAAGREERKRLFAASCDLHTETFVLLAAERIPRLVNERRLETADDLIATASRVAEALGDARSISEAASARSIVARHRRTFDLAVELGDEAVVFAEAAGDPDTLVRALVRRARAAEEANGILDHASLQRAVALADRLRDPTIAAHAATHLARSFEGRERRREALHYAGLALRFADASGDSSARITASLMLGGAYLWIGDWTLAARHLRRATDLSFAAGFPDVAGFALSSLAFAQWWAGDRQAALGTIEEGLQRLDVKGSLPLLRTRLNFHLEAGRLAEAERDLLRTIEMEPLGGTNRQPAENNFAWLRFLQQDYQAALAHARSARGPIRFQDISARVIQAWALRCLGRREEAIRLLEELFAETEEDFVPVQDPYSAFFGVSAGQHLLLDLLVEQGNIPRALEIVELTKASRVRQAVSDTDVERSPILGVAERRQERALEERLRALLAASDGAADSQPAGVSAQRIADARAELVDFRQRAFAMSPALYVRRPSELRLDDLPAHLDGVTILTYAHSRSQVHIFAIGPKESGRRRVVARVAAVDRDSLQDRIDRLTTFIEQRNLRADDIGSDLYDLLVAPVEESVRAAGSLCIIPDGDLWRVPFHALGPHGGRKLVEGAPVFYAPSIAFLSAAGSRRQHSPRRGQPALLAFANPRLTAGTATLYRAFTRDAGLEALPEAETEVRAIAAIYGRERSRVHIGDDAREALLKKESGGYDILHIASHGLILDNAPMFSSVVLAAGDGEDEDGLLEVREVVGLRLGADLAVLSACNTGRSAGVVGLAWAFLAAGCPTTVVSHWSAQSEATTILMIEFHRRLAAGLSRPAALRAAQLRLRENPHYRHTFYWAPFVVVGAP